MHTFDFIHGVGYKVISFPDGEKHLQVDVLDRKDSVRIVSRITCSDDLFLLMQLSDILNRQCVVVEEMFIPYLMTMRCDRLFSFEQPFSLGIVANVINSFKAKIVRIVEPHSYASLRLIERSYPKWVDYKIEDDFVNCLPDKGSVDRYNSSRYSVSPIICSKVRDVNTGNLSGFRIEDFGGYKEGDSIVVVDDLCDGGGTFVGIAEELRKLKPSKLTLAVVHAIQKHGIERVANVYDKVIISNSYKDWNKNDLPENVEVVNVL